MKNPKEIGAIAPSSKFLTEEIMKQIDFEEAKIIVELGPGSGAFTKEIVKRLGSDARLICFEVNKKFCSHIIRSMDDERVTVVNAGAEKMQDYLKKLGIEEADYIVSGLPFRNFPIPKKKKILDSASKSLTEGGKFVLFQYTNSLGELLAKYFAKVERKFVALNVPPSFVYSCGK